MDHGKREKLLWGVGGTAALTVILLSCSTFDTNRTILAPPTIPGAEFVGSDSCDDLPRTKSRAISAPRRTRVYGERRKREERWVANRATDREVCTSKLVAAAAHDHQSTQIAGNVLPMSLGSARTIPIASPSSGAGRQNELRRLP